MLDTLQMSKILTKAGYAVPEHPAGGGAAQEAWTRQIENLYVTYAAARAARSLRESEEARQMERLRTLASMRAYA